MRLWWTLLLTTWVGTCKQEEEEWRQPKESVFCVGAGTAEARANFRPNSIVGGEVGPGVGGATSTRTGAGLRAEFPPPAAPRAR
jgi:hypothetical protein